MVPTRTQRLVFLASMGLFMVASLNISFVYHWIQRYIGKLHVGDESTPRGMEDTKTKISINAIYNTYIIHNQHRNTSASRTKLAHSFTHKNTSEPLRIAILIPTTSRSIATEEFFEKSSLTQISLPALHRTMETSKYNYSIYIGIDQGDYLETVQPQLRNLSKHIIPVIVSSTNFRECVNVIAKKAFDDGNDYFVRINDDSAMDTYNWTTFGIETLESYKPPNVGVVGPSCPEDDVPFMTHDMVHRNHLQIFTLYYPQEFADWFTDIWITMVYSPNRSKKLPNWTLKHKRIHGTRYWVNMDRRYRMKLIDTLDKSKIMAFIYPKRRVVSFTLYGAEDKYIEGALANAELMKTIYPDWVMRIYYDSTVPMDVLAKLANYEYVHLIEMSKSILQKSMWRFLVASDPTVNVYVIRDIDARLSEREKSAVDKWLETDKQFHVMRDHPLHSYHVMPSGLWGGRKSAIPNIGQIMAEINFDTNFDQVSLFLEYVIWPIAQQSVVQHDSFSCHAYGQSYRFPTARKDMEFVGSKYEHGKVSDKMIVALKKANEC